MASGLVSFLGGLGNGGLSEYHRHLALERQDRQDAENKRLNDLRAQVYQGQLDDAQQAREARQGFRDDMKPAAPESGYSVGGAFTKDADAAGVMADMASTNQPVTAQPATRVAGSLFGGDDAGMAAARKYATEQNSPDAYADRWQKAYSKWFPENSLEAQTKVTAFKKAQYDAGRDLIFQQGLQAIDGGDMNALGSLSQPYLNGGSLNFAPATGGGWTAIVTNKDGQQVLSQPIKSADEARSLWFSRVYPDKVLALQAQAAAEQRKVAGQIAVKEAEGRANIARDAAKGNVIPADGVLYKNGQRISNPKPKPAPWSDEAIEKTSEYKLVAGPYEAQAKLTGQPIPPESMAKIDATREAIRERSLVSEGVNMTKEALRRGRTPQMIFDAFRRDNMPVERIFKIFNGAGIPVPVGQSDPNDPVAPAATGATPSAPSAPMAPTSTAPTAPVATPALSMDQVKANLAVAQAESDAANAQARRYGLNQRREDPDGYAKAMERVKAANAALSAAQKDASAANRAEWLARPEESRPYIGGLGRLIK